MTTILERTENFLIGGGLLAGYTTRFRRWLDSDLNEGAEMILFKEPGVAGPSDFCVQKPQVQISMLCSPDQLEAGRERMRQIHQYFYSAYKGVDVVHFQPVGAISGPQYLQNDRVLFRMTVELIVQDQ